MSSRLAFFSKVNFVSTFWGSSPGSELPCSTAIPNRWSRWPLSLFGWCLAVSALVALFLDTLWLVCSCSYLGECFSVCYAGVCLCSCLSCSSVLICLMGTLHCISYPLPHRKSMQELVSYIDTRASIQLPSRERLLAITYIS